MMFPLLCMIVLMFPLGQQQPDEIRVAVASNFMAAMKDIVRAFEKTSHVRVTLMSGSTGRHYAQIRNGAKVDVFFAADTVRPVRLEADGIAVAGSRFTYAVGKIVLWSPSEHYVDPEGRVLVRGSFRHLAIANPRFAPYGKAAREVLEAKGLWTTLESRLVRGENIAQAYQFVHSGNAELGFVALSQLTRPDRPMHGSWWEVPQSLYAPIRQQAVALTERRPVRDFMTYVQGRSARQIIHSHGYETP